MLSPVPSLSRASVHNPLLPVVVWIGLEQGLEQTFGIWKMSTLCFGSLDRVPKQGVIGSCPKSQPGIPEDYWNESTKPSLLLKMQENEGARRETMLINDQIGSVLKFRLLHLRYLCTYFWAAAAPLPPFPSVRKDHVTDWQFSISSGRPYVSSYTKPRENPLSGGRVTWPADKLPSLTQA